MAVKDLLLEGSAQVIVEYFEFAFYSILYQRSIYPPEDFKSTPCFGLHLLKSCNEQLTIYMKTLLLQVRNWLSTDSLKEIVLIIGAQENEEVLERWQFKVSLSEKKDSEKTEQEIHKEIQALMRQITASVTFLPIFDTKKYFEVIVYVKSDTISSYGDSGDLLDEWDDSDQKLIKNPEYVEFRSFSTKIHKIETSITYKINDL